MPGSYSIYKAGKLSFLLVCLFLCSACGNSSKAVFEAGENKEIVAVENLTEEIVENKVAAEEEEKTFSMININTADAKTLMQLPGIGEVRAAAIIEHRTNYGDFEKIEDIMNVKGIKTGIFSKICKLICVK